MNHIARTLNPIASADPNSPTSERILKSEDDASPARFHCGSWRSKLFSKVKECKNAIKSIVTFDKPTNTFKSDDQNDEDERSNFQANLKEKSDDKQVLMRYSTLNQEDEEASRRVTDESKNLDNSLCHFSLDKSTNSSLKSFLALEKQINEEFFENAATTPFKKKISAEPFLSYDDTSAEFLWSDDTEESFPVKASNSSEQLNTSDLGFGNPRRNSTFDEHSTSKNCSSSPTRNSDLADSGFENNFSN